MYRCHGAVLTRCAVRRYHGDGISFQQSNDVVVRECVAEENVSLGFHPGSGSQRPVVRDCVARRGRRPVSVLAGEGGTLRGQPARGERSVRDFHRPQGHGQPAPEQPGRGERRGRGVLSQRSRRHGGAPESSGGEPHREQRAKEPSAGTRVRGEPGTWCFAATSFGTRGPRRSAGRRWGFGWTRRWVR